LEVLLVFQVGFPNKTQRVILSMCALPRVSILLSVCACSWWVRCTAHACPVVCQSVVSCFTTALTSRLRHRVVTRVSTWRASTDRAASSPSCSRVQTHCSARPTTTSRLPAEEEYLFDTQSWFP